MSLLETGIRTDLIEFRVNNEIEASPAVIEATQRAICMVWDYHVSKPTTMNVIFLDKIEGHGIIDPQTGNEIEFPACIDETGAFQFALGTIKNLRRDNFSLGEWMSLISGHEGVHKVQIYRGHPPPSISEIIKNNEHADSLHEIEANIESLHVLKAEHPRSTGTFTWGRYKYSVPAVSKYPSRYPSGEVQHTNLPSAVPIFIAPKFTYRR